VILPNWLQCVVFFALSIYQALFIIRSLRKGSIQGRWRSFPRTSNKTDFWGMLFANVFAEVLFIYVFLYKIMNVFTV
jgi:hypothetical protein